MRTNIVKISIEVNDIPSMITNTTLSTTIWFSGCKLGCKNCQNSYINEEFIGLDIETIIQDIQKRRELTSWINFLGGEPFFNENSIIVLGQLLTYSKSIGYKTFIYSGYEFCEIIDKLQQIFTDKEIDTFLSNIDFIKTGRYDLVNDKKEFDNSYFFETVNQKIVDNKGNKIYYFNFNNNQIIMTDGVTHDNTSYKFNNDKYDSQTYIPTGIY